MAAGALPMGVAPGPSDNLIFDIQNGVSSSGFGHPACKGGKPNEDIIQKLPQTDPIGPKREIGTHVTLSEAKGLCIVPPHATNASVRRFAPQDENFSGPFRMWIRPSPPLWVLSLFPLPDPRPAASIRPRLA